MLYQTKHTVSYMTLVAHAKYNEKNGMLCSATTIALALSIQRARSNANTGADL